MRDLPFITWKNINEIFRAKSTEEFVQILSQEIHKDDFEVRNLLRAVGKVDPKQYTKEVYSFNDVRGSLLYIWPRNLAKWILFCNFKECCQLD